MNATKVVVTNRSLLRSRLAAAAVGVLVFLSGYLMYELGLSRAGFNRMAAMDVRADLTTENANFRHQLKELQEQNAVLETAAKIDREGYRKVEDELIELQNRILDQQEDIEFYKGIFNENDGTGLRIQEFKVVKGLGTQEYDLRLVLAQAFRKDRLVSGSVDIVVEGLRRGEAVRLSLGELGLPDSKDPGQLKYSFRYFQDLKAGLVLPLDFVPERVHVIVRPQGKTSKTVEDFFVWELKPS
jgi:hypothetical protein